MADKTKAKKAKTTSKKASSTTRSKKTTEPAIEVAQEIHDSCVSEQVELKKKENKILPKKANPQEMTNSTLLPLEPKFVSPSLGEEVHQQNTFVSKQPNQKPVSEPDFLNVKLSHSLIRKLKEQAADEGISLEEFVTELLSESVVLRAWEIVERKNQMKGGNGPASSSGSGRNAAPHGNSNGNNNRNSGQRNGNNGNKGHRGMSHMRYQSIMDDKATFLEYVRNQERTRR